MEFVEALQEFLFHQGFQKIKYDSKILWGKDTGDKLSLLEVVPPLLPGQPRIGLKQREEEMLDIKRQIMIRENQILKKEKKRKNIRIYGFLI